MSRGAKAIIVVLLVAVVAMGAVIAARNRGTEPPAPAKQVVVFAPCGMTGPINVVAALFRATHPEIRLEIVFDNANILVKRVRKGERPDVFISPGEVEMKQLTDEGFIDAATIADFGSLDVVVFAPTKTKGLNQLSDIAGPQVKYISMGDPKHNSIGYYGEKALRSLKLWDRVRPKLLLPEMPLEAVKAVSEGQVDAGITYLTCPLETAPEKASKSDLRVVAKFPRDSYPPVRLQVAMLKTTTQRALSQKLISFVASEQAQKALAGTGVLPPPNPEH
ncbi:MAG: molybdate ABC transporter substrate-binding protein [Armatimonadota bacterium]